MRSNFKAYKTIIKGISAPGQVIKTIIKETKYYSLSNILSKFIQANEEELVKIATRIP